MDSSEDLFILWTNSNVTTSQLTIMMYSTNSKIHHWWKNVTVIIWGDTARLAAENETIQEYIKIAQNVGVKFSACLSCANQLGVTEKLRKQDIEVKYWGKPLTDLLKNKENLITI